MLSSFLGGLAAFIIAPAPVQAQELSFFRQLPMAATVQRPKGPKKRIANSLGVRTSSPSVFVADLATGNVLYAKDPHRVMPIASLTKLVTAMVFLDRKPNLDKTLTYVSADIDRSEGKIVIPVGETVTLRDALETMLVGSVNASANAIARVTGGKERFAELMNEKVKSLGLRTPIFVEPSGMNPENRASAADVGALLSAAAAYPEIREIAKLSEVTAHAINSNKDYRVLSTNLLLPTYLNKDPYGIVAAKTGSLPEAGYCMAQITKNKEGHEIVAVELGSDNHFSRYQDIKALTTWAFDTYEWK
ncbi:D-alanyl-D-alanine carboxypeptidase [Patescibacteria group bacterium]|nr:D-alanyl-D-alanine carboxypeptidase [Patescibacteria group bacterium]